MPSADHVQAWLNDYVAAWRSYDEAAIRALFAPEAAYRYHPYDEPLRGAEAILASWLENRDEPGSWEASYAPALMDGDRAAATGETRYAKRRRLLEPLRVGVRCGGPLRELHGVVPQTALTESRLGGQGSNPILMDQNHACFQVHHPPRA